MSKALIAFGVSGLSLFAAAEVAEAGTWTYQNDFGYNARWDGATRARGWGYNQRRDGGSYVDHWAEDQRVDKNFVFARTDWFKLTEVCVTTGVSFTLEASASVCDVETLRTHREARNAPADGKAPDGSWQRARVNITKGWCDNDGKNCANYGFKVVSRACANMGFPVPDQCNKAYVEFHRP